METDRIAITSRSLWMLSQLIKSPRLIITINRIAIITINRIAIITINRIAIITINRMAIITISIIAIITGCGLPQARPGSRQDSFPV